MYRFIVGFIFHSILQGEFLQGYRHMKYALDHPWKFERPGLAVLIGFLQTFVMFMIELMGYIIFVTSKTYLDITLAIIALFFVINFDDIFY